MQATGSSGEEVVTVRISGRGINFERDIPVSSLPRLMAYLLGTEPDVSGAPGAPHTSEVTVASGTRSGSLLERPVGVVEYIREKRPRTASDTVLVLAGYLELTENRRPFGREDLRRLMRAARIPEPANFPRDVGVAVSKGYIQPFGDGFQLTNTGLELVGHPGPLVAPRVGVAARARRRPGPNDEDGG